MCLSYNAISWHGKKGTKKITRRRRMLKSETFNWYKSCLSWRVFVHLPLRACWRKKSYIIYLIAAGKILWLGVQRVTTKFKKLLSISSIPRFCAWQHHFISVFTFVAQSSFFVDKPVWFPWYYFVAHIPIAHDWTIWQFANVSFLFVTFLIFQRIYITDYSFWMRFVFA